MAYQESYQEKGTCISGSARVTTRHRLQIINKPLGHVRRIKQG